MEGTQTQSNIDSTNRIAKNSFIFGLVGIFCLGFILGIPSIYLGITAIKQYKAQNASTLPAVVGLVLGIVAFVGWLTGTIIAVVSLVNFFATVGI